MSDTSSERSWQELSNEASHASMQTNNSNHGYAELENNADQSSAHKRNTHKKHSCYFCKKIMYQLPRHWFKVHFLEEEVKQIMSLHPSNPLRKKKIDVLRKKGDFEHNKKVDIDKAIVMRTSNLKDVKYVPCPSCFGYFSKENIRHHRERCSPQKGDRNLQASSRKLTSYIHEKASNILKSQIAVNMYNDEISNHFLFDEIIILYGNYLCIKYTESHLKNYIRSQLRLLGRFMKEVKIIDPTITCCKDLMHPLHVDTIRKAIDKVSGLNEASGIYEHPTNARSLNTEFKKILEVVQSECFKKDDQDLMKTTKALFRIYKLELTPYINRMCKLSENKYKRSKKPILLPDNKDIGDYLNYLYKNIALYVRKTEKKFSLDSWNHLCKHILVALAVFNRKRPGETQRIELDDFYKREGVTKKDMKMLDGEERVQADKYVRVAFRGKLGNSTAVLIDIHKILPGIHCLLKYRVNAGVHSENRFLFGYPSTKDPNKTFDTYRCHRQILAESGLNVTSLSFTCLRKQFATEVAKGTPSQEDELRVSNYMSHHYDIHKRIYDQSTSLQDITKVSKHLEATSVDKCSQLERKTRGNNSSKRKNNHKQDKRKWEESKEEYTPSSSNDDSYNEIDPVEVERCLGRFQKRRGWTSKEKEVTRDYFKMELQNVSHIERDSIKKFKEMYPHIMKNRSVPMIKQWLEGEEQKIERKREGVQEKRPRFSTPEKEVLELSTERYSLSNSEPSLQELEDIISNNDILKRRSAKSLLQKYRGLQKNKRRGLGKDN